MAVILCIDPENVPCRVEGSSEPGCEPQGHPHPGNFFILTTGQIFQLYGAGSPSLSTLTDHLVWVGGTTDFGRQALCLGRVPRSCWTHAAAAQSRRRGSGFTRLEFHA